MKKNKYIILIALLAFSTNFVYAEVASTTNTQPKKDFIQARNVIRTQEQADIQNIKNNARNDIQLQRENEVKNIFIKNGQRVINRLEATIERLENIMTRIVSRTEKIKADGGKTDVAENYISSAKASITSARSSLDLLRNAAAVASTTPVTASSTAISAKSLHKMALDVEKNIQAAHKLMEKAVGNLRGLSQTAPNATSTNKTN